MSGLPYRAVFFDVGETLLAPHPSFNELFSEIMGGLGYEVTPGDVEEARAPVAPSVSEAIGQTKSAWSTSREESRRFWRGLYGAMLAHWGIDDSSGAIFDVLYGRFTSYGSYGRVQHACPTRPGHA